MENLTLMNCENIAFNEDSLLKLKSLYLGAHCNIIYKNNLIKLPSLEILKLDPILLIIGKNIMISLIFKV